MRKALYILGELEDDDLQALLEIGHGERFDVGREVLREGAHPSALYVVVDGGLVVRRAGAEIAHLGPGEVIGEMSLIDDRSPAVTIEVLRSALLFAVPHSALRARLARDASFAARFYRATCVFLANRLDRADALLGRARSLGDPDAEGSMSLQALERATLAGARYQWFAERVRTAEEA